LNGVEVRASHESASPTLLRVARVAISLRAPFWRVLDRVGIARDAFKPHDLRRTMRSGLASLGVRYGVAERAINHKLPGMAEIYDRNDYAVERSQALAQWADYLDTLKAGGNVIPMQRKASRSIAG
jgi:integrase